MKLESIFVDNFKGLQNLQVDFCDAQGLVQPITVLAGKNGTGKTTLLSLIFSDNSSSRPQYSKWILDTKYNNRIGIQYLHAHTVGQPNEQQNTLAIILSYIDKRIYEDNTPSGEVYADLRAHINEMLAVLDLPIEFSRLDRHKTVYFRNRQKPEEEFTIEELSGGEKSIISRVLPFFLADTRDTLILIDEPENSLHPRWQSQLIGLYSRIAERGNNQFIIATHSPHIVASVDHHCLRIFQRDEQGNIQVSDSSQRSFGKAVDEILLEIFQLEGLRTPSIEKKIAELKALLFANQFESTEFKAAYKELAQILGEGDNELALIRLEILKRRKANEANT